MKIKLASFWAVLVFLVLFTSLDMAWAQSWIKVTPGPTRFMGMDLKPTCSGYTGDNTYSFWARAGSSSNLVIYLQGGGACWSPQSCITSPTYFPDVTDLDHPGYLHGIFAFDLPQNPLKDWSFLYVPYCTGDLHWGSNDWEYKYAPGLSWKIHHRGLENFLAALKWAKERLPRPRKILVTGSSAGGFGAIGVFPWVERLYPATRIYVLSDAGSGDVPREFDALADLHWGVQLPWWVRGISQPIYLPEFWKTMARRHPMVRFGEYIAAWDSTLTWYRNEILKYFGIATDESDVCVDFHTHLMETISLKQEAPNYKSYVAAGGLHVILPRPEFYTESSAGVPFLQWLVAMIEDSPAWQDATCSGDCGKPSSCPY